MRAVLDACVLYPTVLREILLGCAGRDLFVPLWSDRIVEEWRRAALRNFPDHGAQVATEIALVTLRFPGASVPVEAQVEARLSLPDDNDRHVLATAISGQANTLITLNLRDFPGRTLAREAVIPRHPDSLMVEWAADHPQAVRAVVETVLGPLQGTMPPRAILKKAGLPRLGKALF